MSTYESTSRNQIRLRWKHNLILTSYLFPISEYDPTSKIFSCAYPWLFPGGIGDVYADESRGSLEELSGPVKDLPSWGRHLMHYKDGRFQRDQMFSLYLYNVIQRHNNNASGAFFHSDKNWFGKLPPSVEELKQQIRNGDFTFISKLRYFSQKVKGSDPFWRDKANELRAWIDYHIANNNGPPTHFITLSCAENWWPDLRDIYADLEENAGRTAEAKKIRSGNFRAMSSAARRYPMYVNKYYMMRAKRFLDVYAREVFELEHYWGRVEFAPGRGAIHLHILGIAKDKAYLESFYDAKSEADKVNVLEDYAITFLGMTADVDTKSESDAVKEEKNRYSNTEETPMGKRFADADDILEDHANLAHYAVNHRCTEYCLGDVDKFGIKQRTCRFGFGQERTPNQGDTPGKDLRAKSTIEKNARGIEHLLLPRSKSRTINQHSQYALQAWRANCDVQLLIYRSNPNVPDVSEIQAVCNYCASYAVKVHQTTRQEISNIQDVITRYVLG